MSEPCPSRRILVIVSAIVRGARRRRLEATLARLEVLDCGVSVRQTRSRGDAERIAREGARDRYDVVVAAGGDGTVNEVVNGLAGSGLALAVLPLGTANVVAAEIGLPRDPRRLAELIARGTPRPVCAGLLDGRRFVMMAGIGLDAHAVAAVDAHLKRRAGKLAYVAALSWQFLRFPFPAYEVKIDGLTHRAASVIVANGHYYAGRFVCAPEARLDEPELSVCLFSTPGRWHALGYGIALLLGRLERLSDYHVIAARSLSVSGPAGDPVQADGDVVAQLPVALGIDPEPLNLIMPG